MFMFRDLFPVVFDDDDGAGGGGDPQGEPKEPEQRQEAQPPWGKDEDFDPQRAWKLIQDVRADAEKAKGEREKLAAQVKKHEDASKSDREKLDERLQDAEGRASYADKLDVALDKAPEGMSAAQIRKLAKRLAGGTREELEADAEELFADFKPDSNGQAPSRGRPKEKLRTGAAPSSEPEETDPIKLAAKVPRMY